MSTATNKMVMPRDVTTSLNYLGEVNEPLFTYAYDSPPGHPKTNVTMVPRPVVVHDARGLNPVPSVDREGFALVRQRSRLDNFYDEDQVRGLYYPECEGLLRDLTGAHRVVVFDHIVRNAARTNEKGIKMPATAVHNDYTASSGPQRLRDLLPTEAAELLRHRFAIINVWRPLRGPVLDSPLGVCDARSIAPGDLVPNARIYPTRRGEIQAVKFNSAHRWYYFSEMQPEETLLLKCYDSAEDGRARFTAHSAFLDPTAPPDSAPRESIETRALVLFKETQPADDLKS
jgi:hypothetical protein